MQTGFDILKSLENIQEMVIRRQRIDSFMSGLAVPEFALLIHKVMADYARVIDRAVYVDFVAALLFDPGIGYDRRRTVYEAMVELGFRQCAPVLLDIATRYDTSELPFYELEDVPLGVRKAKARTRDRDLLIQMCMDKDPDVIEILLANPIITQAEVMRIVSLRPQGTRVLQRVFCNPRWAYRTPVIAALVLNNWSSPAMAAALTPILDIRTLSEVMQDKVLHPIVRDMARMVYRRIRGVVQQR